MAAHYYIKLYIEMLDDHKVCMLPDRLYRRMTELFLVAGKYRWSNELPQLSELAWMLRLSQDELENDLLALQDTGIVYQENDTWFVTNFEKRQSAATPAERVQRYRDKKQKEEYHCNETLQNSVTNRNVESIVKDIVKDREDKTTAVNLDDFDEIQEFIEQITGYPVPPTPDNIAAINEFVKLGAIEDDFRDALAFLSDRGRVARSAVDLRGSVKTAIAKRIQKGNAKPAQKPYIPEEHASEVY